jgi:hypothetical protein
MSDKPPTNKHVEALMKSAVKENHTLLLITKIRRGLRMALGEKPEKNIWKKYFEDEIQSELDHTKISDPKVFEETVRSKVDEQLLFYIRSVIVPFIQKGMLHLIRDKPTNQEDKHKNIIKAIKYMVGLMPMFLLTDSAFLGRKLIATFESKLQQAKEDIDSDVPPTYEELLSETIKEVFMQDVHKDVIDEMFK